MAAHVERGWGKPLGARGAPGGGHPRWARRGRRGRAHPDVGGGEGGRRARRRRVPPPRDRAGRRRVLAAADLARVEGAGAGAGAPRARSRTRCCPIYREREVGFITRQAQAKLLVVPVAVGGASTSRRWPRTSPARSAPRAARSRCSWPTRRCPRATRPRCRRPPDPPRRRRALVLLHVGHHGGPEGRPAHGPHDPGQRRRHERAPGGHRRRPQRRGVPVHPHRRASAGCSARSPSGSPPSYIERFDPAEDASR